MANRPTVWHNRRDTLLRFVDSRSAGPEQPAIDQCAHQMATPPLGDDMTASYSVYIPIGISSGLTRRHNVTVEYFIDRPYPYEADDSELQARDRERKQGEIPRIGFDRGNRYGHIKRVSPDFIGQLRYIQPPRPDVTLIRPYLEMDRVLRAQPEGRRPAYYEAVLHDVPRGARLRYRIKLYEQSWLPVVIPEQSSTPPANVTNNTWVESDWYSVYVTSPTFAFDDIKFRSTWTSTPDVNVVYWKQEECGDRRLWTFRFDFWDVRRAINDLEIRFERKLADDGRSDSLRYAWFFDGANPGEALAHTQIADSWHLPQLPIINAQYDFVTLTISDEELKEIAHVYWRGTRLASVEEDALVPQVKLDVKPVRLMFAHFANQSINDFFESPNKNYTPHRTYIQTTMYDELGTYSSRPTSNETGVGDGYGFVIDLHKKHRLPCVFSVNGGFLSMLAQDSPEQIAALKQAMSDGLFEPIIGGFGGHRMLFFRTETNRMAIQRGIDIIENILGGTSRAFYPNSRLYASTPNVRSAIADARIRLPLPRQTGPASAPVTPTEAESRIQYVFVDQSAFPPPNDRKRREGVDLWRDYKHSYLWQQRCQKHADPNTLCDQTCETWYWLFIGQKLKDRLFTASDDEWLAGKLVGDLRLHFFYGVSQPTLSKHAIHVYSDDADKAAGNGWFDGDYNGVENHYAAIYAAALGWIAAHPWIKVVSTAQLRPGDDCVGTLDLQQAIDPSIHTDPEHGPDPNPRFWRDTYTGDDAFDGWATRLKDRLSSDPAFRDLGFEYARWYETWRETPALWLETTLGKIANAMEKTVMAPERLATTNRLVQLAQLGFLVSIHEAHWSKKPLESYVPKENFDPWAEWADELPAYRRDRNGQIVEPENFVLALSLQMRNSHVFLCASYWADGLVAHAAGGVDSDKTWKNAGWLIDDLKNHQTDLAVIATDQFGKPKQPFGRPELSWDLDVTENVILYNRQLLVVMDANGGRITHIFAVTSGGEPVVVSGNIKAYQFLGDDRQYGGTLNCNGSVIQNTVSVANHRYVVSDVIQSRAERGTRFNPKPKIETRPFRQGTKRVEVGEFGDEDWLYPDNFNIYTREDRDDDGKDEARWSYPGLTWKPVHHTTATFDADIVRYRDWIKAGGQPGYHLARTPNHDELSFTKTIRLVGNRILVSYDGNIKPGHLVANELSLDLYSMLMHGTRQNRAWIGPLDAEAGASGRTPDGRRPSWAGCLLSAGSGRVQAELLLGEACRFSDDTLDGTDDLRLHRAFSDCLEVESTRADVFSYEIRIHTR